MARRRGLTDEDRLRLSDETNHLSIYWKDVLRPEWKAIKKSANRLLEHLRGLSIAETSRYLSRINRLIGELDDLEPEVKRTKEDITACVAEWSERESTWSLSGRPLRKAARKATEKMERTEAKISLLRADLENEKQMAVEYLASRRKNYGY